MGWGVLDDKRYPSIPGTVNLNEKVDASKLEDWEYEEPKKRGDIVLQPQPSDSPNDPLNWSTATKITILLILSLIAGVTVSLGPMITTGFDEIAATFHVSADQISFNIVGLLQLTTGGGTFFTAAAAVVWGKRPVFIISTIALLGTSAWGFFAGVSLCIPTYKPTHLIHITELPLLNNHESLPRFRCCSFRNTYQRHSV